MKTNNKCFRHVYLDLSMLGLPGKSLCLENQCRMKSNHPLSCFANRTCEILNLHSVVQFF